MSARLVCIGLILPAVLSAQETVTPLFASSETLHFTLVANFDEIHKDRGQESEYEPAQLFFGPADSGQEGLPLKIRTRGLFRLKRSTCKHPPLRLNFPKKSVEGTVFGGQDKLKLVTHCQERDSYEQNLLEEYLVYRTYNLVTDISFRARLARITYVDARGKDDPLVRYGFLIEDEDAMAARLEGVMAEAPQAPPSAYDDEAAALLAVFQYMVGNTDFSIVHFHNIKLFRSAQYAYFPIAYDFDWSGLVDAPYAKPDPILGTRSVRERVYRGYCRPTVDFASLFAHINGQRDAIRNLFLEQEGLDDRSRKRAVEYIDDFFETIEDSRRADRRIVRSCLRT